MLAPLLLAIVAIGCSDRGGPDDKLVPQPPPAASTDVVAVPPVEEAVEVAQPELKPDMEAPGDPPPTEPVPEESAAEEPSPDAAPQREEDPLTRRAKRFDFGEPLVEGLGENERLHRTQPVWLTKDCKSVVMQSAVCQRQAPLEMFACMLGSKEHESVLSVPVLPSIVHTGLLACGAEPGTPVRWDPEYAPPTGSEIEVKVIWKDEDGKIQEARAQDWVKDMTTGEAMAHPWVFPGSKLWEDEETGMKHYMGDSSGDLICVSNFSSATLDVPIQSSDSNAALMFEAFTERIPPLNTPVTIVLTPVEKEPEEAEAE